jgi:hypothetical protein
MRFSEYVARNENVWLKASSAESVKEAGRK